MSPADPNDLQCEQCFEKTTATPADEDMFISEINGDAYDVECINCAYTGWVIVEDGEITSFGGDMFGEPEHSSYHHGWREEPNVMYREHYRFEHESDDSPPLGDSDAWNTLTFTNDEILAGFDPTVTYECSCPFTSDSKADLANHLLAVAHNRGEDAI